MSTLGSNADVQDLEDELLFQATVLNSLDDSESSAEPRRQIEAIIHALEERIARANDSVPRHSQSDASLSHNPPGAYPNDDDDMSQDLPYFDAQASFSSPAGNASLKRRLDGSSPLASFDSRKRSAPTPMPPPSQRPLSQDHRTALERQRQIEAAARQRRESVAADAALASSMSRQPAPSPVAGPSRSTAHTRNDMSPSRMAPMFRPPGYRSNSSSQAPSPAAYPTPNLPRVKPESQPSPAHPSPARPVKPETSKLELPRARQPGIPTVIDLTGSDEDESGGTTVDRMKAVAEEQLRRRHRLWEQQHAADQQREMAHRRQQEMLRRQQEELARQQEYARRNPHLNQAMSPQRIAQMQEWQRQVAANAPHNPLQTPQHRSYTPLNHAAPYMQPSPAMHHLSSQRSPHPSFSDLTQLNGLINSRGRQTSFEVIDDDSDDLQFVRSQAIYKDPASWDIYDSENTKEELRKLMENIQPDDVSKIANEEDVPIEGLTIKLKPYQNAGLEWLQKMEDGTNKGGILADDMGLGKTVQAISLMVTRRSEDPVNKTTLILAPVALLRQWEQEIMTKVKPGRHRLHTFVHHAGTKKKTHKDLRDFDVVLTTFGTIAAELKRVERYELRKKADPEARPRDDEKCLFIGEECKWYRIIVDEAQCIKNKTTKTARAAFCLQARSRFCMTGTPMMNSVEELYSLIHFLRIKPYNNWNRFRSDFNQPLRGTNEKYRELAMQKLQALLKAILLRRNKQTKINGRPILNLPERRVEEANPEFSSDERELYVAIETSSAVKFNKFLKAGTVSKSYAQILVLLLRLRQACCHPHLIKDLGVVAATAEISQDTMDDICKNLDPNVVARIKEANGVFECPVCYDAVENPAIFTPCGHDTCPECFTRIADPSNAVAQGDEQGRIAKCPECRGEINIKKVIDYECFKRIHLPEQSANDVPIKNDEDAEEMDVDSDDDSDDSEADDESETESLDGFIVKDDVEGDEAEDDEDAAERKQKAALKAKSKGKGKGKARMSKKAKGKLKESSKSSKKKQAATMSIPELKKLAVRSASWRKIYLRVLKKGFVLSAKIEETMKILEEIVTAPEGEKVIIFSQWTSLLDLLEVPVSEKGWGYRRYDGSMNAKLRADAVDDFKNRNNVRMMLVSLKAGNAGLNLNCASRVIIMDPFWNPYIEEQAIDRAHRLGQTRPVQVHRILIKETVEDRIIALQEKKRALISQALDEKASQSLGRLSVQELAYLFGINRGMNDPLPAAPQARQGVAGGLGA